MGRVFWIITAALLGIAIHISYVLFLPGLTFEKKLASITQGQQDNDFAVLDPAVQSSLVQGASPSDVVGLCKLNLSSGKLLLNADLPSTYWTLTVYDSTGQPVYVLTDAQSGAHQFTVDFSRAKGVIEQLFGNGEQEDALVGDNLGWHAEVGGQRGLAVIWVPVSDPLLRPAVVALVNKTKCVPAGS
jgi:uncharacterized membrane protein